MTGFVDATIKGQVPKDHHILRQISAMANMLPAIDSDQFREEFLVEYNDTLLVTYLSAITKGCNVRRLCVCVLCLRSRVRRWRTS